MDKVIAFMNPRTGCLTLKTPQETARWYGYSPDDSDENIVWKPWEQWIQEGCDPSNFHRQSDDDFLLMIAQQVPAGVQYSIIDASSIPEDRSDRDTWTIDHDTKTIIMGS